MSNSWYRMYNEFASDPKVQMLSEAMQRRLIMIFCLRSGNVLETLQETEIAFHLRLTMEELDETKTVFLQKDFIDEDWNVTNWNKRQYISDSSTERVRKYRQGKKQSETFQKQDETNAVTASEQIQNRTEQKKTVEKVEKFIVPEFVPQGLWDDFEQVRRDMKKPLTDNMRAFAVRKLEGFKAQGYSIPDVMEQTIFNRNQGFWADPLKTPKVHVSNGNGNPSQFDDYGRKRKEALEQVERERNATN